jgi:monodehydroascorbate reductase (NADH)
MGALPLQELEASSIPSWLTITPVCACRCNDTGANPAAYDYLPFFYSREFSLSWQCFGVQSDADAVVTWGDLSPAAAQAAATGAAARFGAFWVKGGTVVGAFIEGPTPEDSAALRAVVAARAPAPDTAVLASEGAAWALAAASKL